MDDEHLDPEVVSRVIRRALEISGPITIDDSKATGVRRDALIAAAGEVGLPVVAVLRSIAVEHLGQLPAARVGDRIVGAAVIAVDDEIAGTPEDVLARIDRWLVDGHHRRRDRLRGGTGEWSKRSGLVGGTMRRMRKATGEGRLGDYRHVGATAEDIGTGSTAVRVTVDRQTDRTLAAAGGAAVILGGAGGVVATAAAGPVVLLAAPFVIVGGVSVALSGRRRAKRTEVEIARLLEAVADHNTPTRLRVEVAQRMTGRKPAIGRGTSAG
ncbi:MAG: hypothetical protein JWL72_3149 [Ilumatobacteraceae bacterium]|nr:hypothetical protein [Ilumatobacteraceae bacterium]